MVTSPQMGNGDAAGDADTRPAVFVREEPGVTVADSSSGGSEEAAVNTEAPHARRDPKRPKKARWLDPSVYITVRVLYYYLLRHPLAGKIKVLDHDRLPGNRAIGVGPKGDEKTILQLEAYNPLALD
ncbi:unnamed protein product [Vitrella brassicaformis CCMP3155]|uniref:Uncharacterized protein n=2 Tax=Vitrella brassicaformis TaxID=1169539 RepID=A0A0G4GFN0_VITBC|nr:unnamed protein product [Vitrella brassicaformis CCMP3155]|mmetsp:Transcript_53515/g.134709  ORF Transcript_53515/g.134709 Transcript_53515/m.134709 type:complete len:127 (+) Transcript_53515:94-474(+)|eukprot:CEM28331.1 unnamed protein product [Vitrella brassicaformis CCMP3155]